MTGLINDTMVRLSQKEMHIITGGNLVIKLIGALCALGDYLSDRYSDEVMDTIERGDIGELVD